MKRETLSHYERLTDHKEEILDKTWSGQIVIFKIINGYNGKKISQKTDDKISLSNSWTTLNSHHINDWR